jgi:NAD(P)H-hydrate epimerase
MLLYIDSMKVSSVEQMRDLDRTAIEQLGIPEELLMENAGLAVYHVIRRTCGVSGRSFTVVCGTGNNGGDGFVVARKLHSEGGEVSVFLLGPREKLSGAAELNAGILDGVGIEICEVTDLDRLRLSLEESDAVIDALFGTGLTRTVEGNYRDAIKMINASRGLVYSVDIPSGVNGNTGEVMGVAVTADFTITFGLPKVGNIVYPGWDHCGNLSVTHISFPPALYGSEHLKTEIAVPSMLPPRPADGHKSTFGTALFIAGAAQYYGAPYFSSMSFLRCGGGYARLVSTPSVISAAAAKSSEIVFHPVKESATGSIAYQNIDVIKMLAAQAGFVVLGPGISLGDETQKLALELVPSNDKPLLLDGDGLTAVAKNPLMLEKRSGPTILTPHPGEMARLTGLSVKEIEANRVETVREYASKFKAIIVLKGAHTVTAFPNGRVAVNMSGNSGMGTAGSGDVLTGIIAAMAVQDLPLEEAVITGVFLHGFAGDIAAGKLGEDGMTAGDILNTLPEAVKHYREEYHALVTNHYNRIRIE